MIRRETLLPLPVYAQRRSRLRAALVAHRRLRSVALGPSMTVQFEDEATMRYQIQEMLHVERIVDEAGIAHELQTYATLVPDGTNWKATLLIEVPDADERRCTLARLAGVEHRLAVEVDGCRRVAAIADEDLPRSDATKTSAVHFLRFEFDAATRQTVRAGAAMYLVCDHPAYVHRAAIAAATRDSLVGDWDGAPSTVPIPGLVIDNPRM